MTGQLYVCKSLIWKKVLLCWLCRRFHAHSPPKVSRNVTQHQHTWCVLAVKQQGCRKSLRGTRSDLQIYKGSLQWLIRRSSSNFGQNPIFGALRFGCTLAHCALGEVDLGGRRQGGRWSGSRRMLCRFSYSESANSFTNTGDLAHLQETCQNAVKRDQSNKYQHGPACVFTKLKMIQGVNFLTSLE